MIPPRAEASLKVEGMKFDSSYPHEFKTDQLTDLVRSLATELLRNFRLLTVLVYELLKFFSGQ